MPSGIAMSIPGDARRITDGCYLERVVLEVCGRAWRMIRRRGITCRSQRADYRMAEVGKAVNRLDRPLLGPSSRACFQRSHQLSRSVATRTIYPLDVTGELVGMEVDRSKATSGVAVDLVSKVQ